MCVYLFRRDRLTMRFRGHFWGAALLFTAYQLYMGFRYGENIGNWAHLGGFLTGFAIGAVLPVRQNGKQPWLGWLWGLVAVGLSLRVAGIVVEKWEEEPQAHAWTGDELVRVGYMAPEGWRRLAVEGRKARDVKNYLYQILRR